MLLTRISQPPPSFPTPEDIFASALTTIFTDDTVNSHGTPGSYVTYRSPRFGDLKLFIPAHPDEEDGRKLFAHYLWNAAVLAADGIESASSDEDSRSKDVEVSGRGEGKAIWDKLYWDMRGNNVLELGAGTALPSLLAALSGARSCTITDHPSSPSLTTGAIESNVEVNFSAPKDSISESSAQSQSQLDENAETQPARRSRTKATVEVLGYTWGTSTFYLSNKYGKPASQRPTPQYFDRIIIADCLWMPGQHINLIRTILQFLPPKEPDPGHSTPSFDSGNQQRSHDVEGNKVEQVVREENQEESQDVNGSCALVVAGFHTGRRIVFDFFSLATDPPPPPQVPPAHSDDAASSSLLNAGEDSPLLNDNEENPESPNPAITNTIPLDPATLTPSESAMCGLLRLTSIFEVDVDGNTRAWQKERSGEGKWEAKRWCVVGVLVRR